VVIRPISGLEGTIIYSQHAHPTTVARISPSGYYCASADSAGNVRVWDLVGNEQILKLEIRALGGRITDLQWDSESKRIGVVGEGKDKFGHFFLVDSGSSCGEVSGHSKVANAIALKYSRPFRAATASDDGNIVFYTGVPFKYQKTSNHHKSFVQTLSYAPDGSVFASGGSDGQLILHDGTSGDLISPLKEEGAQAAHRGTLFSCSFSADSKLLASCGADGVVNIWNISDKSLQSTFDLSGRNSFALGAKADDQLVGCTFLSKGEQIAVVSLAGEITVIQIHDQSMRKLLGATKAIAVNGLSLDITGKRLIAGSMDGRALVFDDEVDTRFVEAAPSASAILGVSSHKETVWVISMDDTVRKIIAGRYDATFSVPTTGQPRSIASGGGSKSSITAVATSNGLDIIACDTAVKKHTSLDVGAGSVAVSDSGEYVAVGGEDGKVILYKLRAGSGDLNEEAVFDGGRSAVTSLAFSVNGTLLAAGESSGKIVVYDLKEKKLKFNQWVFHSARINAIEFSPDGTHAVSASLDTNIYIWSTLRPMKSIAIKNAFAGGATGACWLDDGNVACAGADGSVKIYAITRHT
jgi:WD40 repeat protein